MYQAALERQLLMPHGVHASVDRVQAAVAHAGCHRTGQQAAREQLIEGEDAPLLSCDPRHPHIRTSGDFVAHIATNSPLVNVRPMHAARPLPEISP